MQEGPQDHPSEDEQPLIDGLIGLPAGSFVPPPPPADLRETILAETLRVVRRRAMRRQLLGIAGAAALYLLGLATCLVSSSLVPDQTPPARGLSPADPGELLDQVASAAPADRVRLLRQAGDAYLSKEGDMERALDCYRQLLEIAPEAELEKSGDCESWLLASLKVGRVSKNRR